MSERDPVEFFLRNQTRKGNFMIAYPALKAEEKMDATIFRTGKGANYNGRIADIRRYRLAMLADKKIGRWVRFVGFLKGLKRWILKQQK